MAVLKSSSIIKENAMFESPAAVFIHSARVTLPSLPTFAANLLLSPLPWFILSPQYWSSKSANVLHYEGLLLVLCKVKIPWNPYFSDTRSTPSSALGYSFLHSLHLMLNFQSLTVDRRKVTDLASFFQDNYLLLFFFNFWLEGNWKQVPGVRCNSS